MLVLRNAVDDACDTASRRTDFVHGSIASLWMTDKLCVQVRR
jgi:hypothetical protein